MKPRILIDARMVSRVEHGISRYVTAIAEAYEKRVLGNVAYEPIFVLSRAENIASIQPWSSLSVVEVDVPFLNPREWFEIPRLIRSTGAAAFHSPSFASFVGLRVPYMQTVHDLIHLHHGSFMQRIYYQLLLKSFAHGARVLATVSYAVRDELAAWLGVSPMTIDVQPNVFETEACIHVEADLEWLYSVGLKSRSYFLAVANEKPHKNLAMLKRAHASSGGATPLIIAHEFLHRHGHARSNSHAFSVLMRNARHVFSPSLIEGFGRVPVEAILAGVGVTVSSIPAHMEIFDGLSSEAVNFVEPSDERGWAEAFMRAEYPLPRKDLQDRLLKRFTMMELWSRVHRAYMQLVSEKHPV